MYSEHYVLRLLCDFAEHRIEHGEGVAQFDAPTRAACFTLAREAGWKTYPAQRKAKCPICTTAARSDRQTRSV